MESAPPSTFLESKESFLVGWKDVKDVSLLLSLFCDAVDGMRKVLRVAVCRVVDRPDSVLHTGRGGLLGRTVFDSRV